MTEQVNCPVCGRRLFDKEGAVIGAISIKCPHCRKVARLQLEKQPLKRTLRRNIAIPSNGVK